MEMFYKDGQKQQHPAVIPIPDIQHRVFCSVLEYVYTDQITEQECGFVVHLLSAAEHFKVDRLRALCEDIVRKSITTANVVGIMLVAHKNNAAVAAYVFIVSSSTF